MWTQSEIELPARPRGIHLITREVVKGLPELKNFDIGLLHLFIQHTSASLTINENADPDVRVDMESALNALVPEKADNYTHTVEGPDDMPAHIKSSMLGCGVTIPIRDGQLQLGMWQGIYLCEHRNRGGSRKMIATIHGRVASGQGHSVLDN